MDPHLRLQIGRAISSGFIDKYNASTATQGKEAIVYHATKNASHDVAIKVLKRKVGADDRLEYISDDPRYSSAKIPDDRRERIKLWAEKEFRNLVRANRAKVPVPTPMQLKDNIVFMRFMGHDGMPAPHLSEIDIPQDSWDTLYTQVMESVRRLYNDARLVHADLRASNILVTSASQVENSIGCVIDDDSTNDSHDPLQAVLIDFGQAVDLEHPSAEAYLQQDLSRIQGFFESRGVQTLNEEECLEFVRSAFEDEQEDQDNTSMHTLDLSLGGNSGNDGSPATKNRQEV